MTQRARYLSHHPERGDCIVYWMSRDQRVHDNWALLYAQHKALEKHLPLVVVFYLTPHFLGAQPWHFTFMREGLQELEKLLATYHIPFFLISGSLEEDFLPFLVRINPAIIITDFDPLRIKQQWKHSLAHRIPKSLIEVDTHNIVPCWIASDHQEVAARTLRPKLHRLLPLFLTDIPPLEKHPYPWQGVSPFHQWPPSASLPPFCPPPGETAAWKAFRQFLDQGIHRYATDRNNPLAEATSHLSCYFHFGNLSPQRVAYEISHHPTISEPNTSAFLEELIVRRELSDNFVFYQKHYDSWEGIPSWAKKTLDHHRDDPREFLYDKDALEAAKTHDPLWNACQKTLRFTGYLHGYLRMYWAKKILEWSPSPEEAITVAISLNDRYFLDGRDPNGYVGVLWSIGGLHDRPFSERPIIGQIRPMTFSGCARKFSVSSYIQWAENLYTFSG
ncbi:MAG: deoxyribodipyrimidine photo-lyase [Brevinematales bacterium]|nr:deoxyribodipyrimidine photo-lyase [Brevinematales bacterium]